MTCFPRLSAIARSLPALLIAILLTACGGDSPAATPTPSPPVTATAGVISSPSSGLTVGQLADRIGLAWRQVETIRQVRSSVAPPATPGATPSAGPDSTYLTEVDARGSKRVAIEAGGVIIGEIVAIAGDIWARGFMPIPVEATGPELNEGWVAITPEAAEQDPTAAQLITAMLAPYPPLYSGLSTAQRERIVEPLGPRRVGDRTCEAFRIPVTTQTGEAYDVILTLDERDLPCAVETIAFGQATIDIFTFNEEFTIARPG